MLNKVYKIYIHTIVYLLYLLAVFFICRIGFIIHTGIINSAAGTHDISLYNDILQTIIAGFRYDGRFAAPVALIFTALYIIFSIINHGKKAAVIIYTSIVSYIIIIASIVNDTYYSIFNDTFNIILLGVVYDDQSAIFHTAVNSEYNTIPKIALSFIIAAVSVFIYYKIYKKIESTSKNLSKRNTIIFGVVLVYFMLVIMSSTLSLKGGDLNYLVRLPENNFLKKAAPGALHDLDRVVRAYKEIKGESFEKYAGGKTINQVMKIYFDDRYNNQDNISSLMEKEVKENGKSQAKHIFLIIMESLSEYHLSKEFMQAGIGNDLIELAESKDGLKMPVFIQNGYGTIETMDMMITGLYGTYFPISELTGGGFRASILLREKYLKI